MTELAATRQSSRKLRLADIQLDEDVLRLGDTRFYRPYVTAAAINTDVVAGDGVLGGVMLAQTSPRDYSQSTGLSTVGEHVFVIDDDAREHWEAIKAWLRSTSVDLIETSLPNASFLSLFVR